MVDLFINVAINATKHGILLIDTSGSVLSAFRPSLNVIGRMLNYCEQLQHNKYNIVFWNSAETHTNFDNGYVKIPFQVEKAKLSQLFKMYESKITDNCLTDPSVGFNAIDANWIDNKTPTHIYLVTDGQIYGNSIPSLKLRLRDAINRLFKTYNNVHLHIITVEPKHINLDNENVNNIAGGDVFNVFRENNMTNFITEFTTICQNHDNGYRHINMILPPQGFVPFDTKCFSELRTSEFIMFLIEHIKTLQTDDAVMALVQKLTTTIRYLVKDKPQHIVSEIINTFCGLFKNTNVDEVMIKFMLTDSIKSEIQGQSLVYSEYRTKLKQLFKYAQDLLNIDTKSAVNINRMFMTLPYLDKIIIGNHNMVSEKFKSFNRSAIKLNNILLPTLPLLVYSENLSEINEQCIRQLTRAIIAQQYGVGVMDDSIIHIVLGLMLKIVISDVSDDIKNAFRKLGMIMLKKKRLNTIMTEFDNIEAGALPTPNSGQTEQLFGYLEKVKQILDIRCRPLTLWYAICLALNQPQVLVKQLIHCATYIEHDFPNMLPNDLLKIFKGIVKPIQSIEISVDSMLDYTCLITSNNIEQIGGYKFKRHVTLSSSSCYPLCVLSETGYAKLFEHDPICPVCYSRLNRDQFERIGPKPPNAIVDVFPPGTDDIFGDNNYRTRPTHQVQYAEASSAQAIQAGMKPDVDQKRFLIIMKGTVGSGKSTYAKKIQERVEKIGGFCVNEGPDKYCKTGMHISNACSRVEQELRTALSSTNKLVVAIVDTCGERSAGTTNIFGLNFNGFTRIELMPNYNNADLEGYIAWSLRNVLNRHTPTTNDNYNLNPESATVDICVNVMFKKCKALFGKRQLLRIASKTKEAILAEITPLADRYQQYLTTNVMIDSVVDSIMNQM